MSMLLLVETLAEKAAEKAVEASVGKSVEVATTKVIGKSNTALLSSIVACFSIGYAMGWGCRKYLMVTLGVVGVTVLGIIILDALELLHINWDAVYGLASEAQREAQVHFKDRAAMHSFLASTFEWARHNILSIFIGAIGFILGYRPHFVQESINSIKQIFY